MAYQIHYFFLVIARSANIGQVIGPVVLFFLRTKDPIVDSQVRFWANKMWGYFSILICCNRQSRSQIIRTSKMNQATIFKKQKNLIGYRVSLTKSSIDMSKEIDKNKEIKRIIKLSDLAENDYTHMWYNLIPIQFKQYLIRTVISFIGNLYYKRMTDWSGNIHAKELGDACIMESENYEVYQIKAIKFMDLYDIKEDI